MNLWTRVSTEISLPYVRVRCVVYAGATLHQPIHPLRGVTGVWRDRLLRTVADASRCNLVVLTGDIHSSWANEIADTPYDPANYDPATGTGSRVVELFTPGIAPAIGRRVLNLKPHANHIDFSNRGYALIDVDRDRTRGEWYHLDDGPTAPRIDSPAPAPAHTPLRSFFM